MIYDLIFLLIALFHLPAYLIKRKFHSGFRARLGFLPRDLSLGRPIWVHAVSVGEAMAVRGLVDELRMAKPDRRFVISTVTATGNKIAQGIARKQDFVTYLPLDSGFIVKKVIDRVNPSIFIIAETEIWPNLITYLYKRKIPVIIVNGRISDASFRGYSVIKFLIKPILQRVSFFCVQTERDKDRLMRLGAAADKIQVTGNMKFDLKEYGCQKDYAQYRLKLGLAAQEKLLVAASTHPGEEKIILGVFKNLLKSHPNLRLLIAPRHPQRALEIEDLIKKSGFEAQRISLLGTKASPRAIFILDTIGQLISFYAIADIVFVGGSFARIGGHNILEPAALEKPVLFGPLMFNFRDIAHLFLSNKAAIMVNSSQELGINISNLLNNPHESIALGRAARELLLKNQGATLRNARLITTCLST